LKQAQLDFLASQYFYHYVL